MGAAERLAPLLVLVAALAPTVAAPDGFPEVLVVDVPDDTTVNDLTSIVAPAGAPATCSLQGGVDTADEWRTTVSIPPVRTVMSVSVFLFRSTEGTAVLDGGLTLADNPPDSATLGLVRVSQTVPANGAWIRFDIPDVELEQGVYAFVVRSAAGHAAMTWETGAPASVQGSMRQMCAGTSETTWRNLDRQGSIRVYANDVSPNVPPTGGTSQTAKGAAWASPAFWAFIFLGGIVLAAMPAPPLTRIVLATLGVAVGAAAWLALRWVGAI